MLVVISDIHLTDLSTAHNVHATAFDLMCREISTAAQAKGAVELQVVLLGDIFDLVRTDFWHRTTTPDQRPWGGDLDPETGMNRNTALIQTQFATVLAGVLATPEAKGLITTLNGLSTVTNLPTKLTYVVGNHDRVFNNFPALQQQVRAVLPGIEFANLFKADDYGVLARHGHEWDENCHGFTFYNKVLRPDGAPQLGRFDARSYQVMAIGEVVTAELMSGLVHFARAAQPGNVPDFPQFIEAFKDINNIRPTLDVFPWLEWFARDQLPGYKQALHQAMKQSLDGVLQSSLAKKWDRLVTDLLLQGDLTDRLALLKNHVLGNSFDEFRGRVNSLSKLQGLVDKVTPDKDECAEGAEEEEIWRFWTANPPGPTQYVLYGHTHKARHVAFGAAVDGRVRMYINTGTLLPLIQRTSSRDGFSTASQMTMAFFYKTEEDKTARADRGPTLDLWNGIRRKTYV
jgi:UDP-2,3-diacylglucosamine pyrophosphatase LpxH